MINVATLDYENSSNDTLKGVFWIKLAFARGNVEWINFLSHILKNKLINWDFNVDKKIIRS